LQEIPGLDKRAALGAGVAALTVLLGGVLLGTFVGKGSDPEGLGSPLTEIAAGKRLEPIPPLPRSAGVPPLKTAASESVQPLDEAAKAEPVYTPEPEYVPPEEKTPYIPPPTPEPAPAVTVGKNE
jgi:hypothetical protein